MLLVDGNQIIQTLATKGRNYPLAVGVCHGTSNWSFQHAQTKTIQSFVNLSREDRVAIVNQIMMARFAVEERAELLSRPLRSRMIRNIDVQNATRADLHCYEHVQDLERCCD